MGYIYFIQAGDENYFKIGSSAEFPSRRLKELQTGNHLPLTLARVIEYHEHEFIERLLHKTFREQRLIGEWFKLDISQIDFKLRALEELGITNENSAIDQVATTMYVATGLVYGCSICDQVYSSQNALNGHMLAHRLNPNKLSQIIELLSQGHNKTETLAKLGITNAIYWRRYAAAIDEMLATGKLTVE